MARSIRKKHIRKVAEQTLRDTGNVTPPIDIESIAESLGITVLYKEAESNFVGFLLKKSNPSGVVIGINSLCHEYRARYTIARYCGYFLLHTLDTIRVDSIGKSNGMYVDSPLSKGPSIKEKEIGLFASEILMPQKDIDTEVSKLQTIDLLEDNDSLFSTLADRYKVTSTALTARLFYLGYIGI